MRHPYHIVALAGPEDEFQRSFEDADTVIVPFDIPGDPNRIEDSTPDVFAAHGLHPPPLARDLLRLAIAAYVADMRVGRNAAFDGWTRDFVLHVFVSDPTLWNGLGATVTTLLRFLTGDRWDVEFRATPGTHVAAVGKKPKHVHQLTAKTVSLFSGGLDSYIGAIDALEDYGSLLLVGHEGGGGGATSWSQDQALEALRTTYDEIRAPFLQFWIAPPKIADGVSETTTRGRSLLFAGLGIAVATAVNGERLVVPENGMISLNVPLTSARLGSFSTRTTHPYYVALLGEIVRGLALGVDLVLPYRFQTKGEMVRGCRNVGALAHGVASTMSCSHPDSNRFHAKNPHLHCGRCIPCLIRRAALRAAGADPTPYHQTDLGAPIGGKSEADLRALRIALERYRRRPPRIGDLLAAGPLPGSDGERLAYLEVFRRGVTEVDALLKAYPEAK